MKRVGTRVNEVAQMRRMLGKAERDKTHQNYQREIETGRGIHIDVGQIELGWAKWMRGGASPNQGEGNRNGLGPFEMGWDM